MVTTKSEKAMDGPRFKPANFLLGVRHWMAVFGENRKPRIEVFRYLGQDTITGRHYFQSIKENVLVWRTEAELQNSPHFRPFCMDMERSLDALDQLHGVGKKEEK
jgi:hypothetical protein